MLLRKIRLLIQNYHCLNISIIVLCDLAFSNVGTLKICFSRLIYCNYMSETGNTMAIAFGIYGRLKNYDTLSEYPFNKPCETICHGPICHGINGFRCFSFYRETGPIAQFSIEKSFGKGE